MSIITSIVKAINIGLKQTAPKLVKSVTNVIERVTQFGMKQLGFSTKDILDTIVHSDIDTIADKLHQSTFTVARLIDTEQSVLATPKNKLLPRNLIVSGNLKTGQNYRYFYTGDVLDANGKLVTRKWFSIYTNTQKAFSEIEEDIQDSMSAASYEMGFTIDNLSLHHIIHQRGAGFFPIQTR